MSQAVDPECPLSVSVCRRFSRAGVADNFITRVGWQIPRQSLTGDRVITMLHALLLACLLASVNSWGGWGGKQAFGFMVVVPDGYKCPWCQNSAREPVVAVCQSKHVLCQNCATQIQRWVDARCPRCRQDLLERSLPAVRELQLPKRLSIFSGGDVMGQNYLPLPYWWRVEDGQKMFDSQLYRAFVSLFQGKDKGEFPTKEQVDAFMARDIWWRVEEGSKVLDRDLLMLFFPMFRGQGFPPKKPVDDFLRWGIWWRGEGANRVLDRELLALLSPLLSLEGMFSTEARVHDLLQWGIWWQGEGANRVLDRELLALLLPILSGRDPFPSEAQVHDFLTLNIFQQGANGTLDRELLTILSPVLSVKGLLPWEKVTSFLQWNVWWKWEGDGRALDRELLEIFAPILGSKEFLPSEEQLYYFLRRDLWWQNQGGHSILDRKLLLELQPVLCAREPLPVLLDSYLTTHKLFPCRLCPYTSQRRDGLREHRNIHFQCDKCHFIGESWVERQIHAQSHRARPQAWSCDLCDYRTSCLDAFEEHMSHHGDAPPFWDKLFQCEQCDFATEDQEALEDHLQYCGEEPSPSPEPGWFSEGD